jgi:hypothetical protein
MFQTGIAKMDLARHCLQMAPGSSTAPLGVQASKISSMLMNKKNGRADCDSGKADIDPPDRAANDVEAQKLRSSLNLL